jgi:hypothetical protein
VNAALDVLDALEAELLFQMRQEARRAEWEAQRALGKRWARMYNPHYKKFARDEATGEIDAQGKAHGEESGRYVETEGGSGSAEGESKSSPLEKLLGPEYTGVKGQAAIDKLLQERHGHVKAAFYRKEIGHIDLLWGHDGVGLQHIIKRRNEDGYDGEAFLLELGECIEKGSFRVHKNGTIISDRGNFELLFNNKIAVISPNYRDTGVTLVLTAFKTRSKK